MLRERDGWAIGFLSDLPFDRVVILGDERRWKMLGSLLITLFVFVPVVVLSKLLAHSRKVELQPVRVVSSHGRRARRRS
jgi:hypothetical protein